MKTVILLALALFAAQAHAAMPCQTQSNYGKVKWISAVPYWNAVRFKLVDGRTDASTSGIFSLPVTVSDAAKQTILNQNLALLNDAQARGRLISVETTNCQAPMGMPTAVFLQSGAWFE